MRQAFLILAHGRFDMLEFLVKALDSPESDIFIHVDARVKDVDIARFENLTAKSKTVCLRNRVACRWGSVALVDATFRLIDEALSSGTYRYLHLLSGCDFPLMSPSEMLSFLSDHDGAEFIGFCKGEEADIEDKLGVYHIPSLLRSSRLASWLEYQIAKTQRLLGIRMNRDTSVFRKGPQWWTITDDLAKALLPDRTTILRRYRWAFAPDEIFMQTFVSNHPEFLSRCFDGEGDKHVQCMRLIDWDRGAPYEFTEADCPELASQRRFFVRKMLSLDVMKALAAIKGARP